MSTGQLTTLQQCVSVWLKTAFAVLVQEGGVLVHRKGIGGSGKGKIGARADSSQFMDLVGI